MLLESNFDTWHAALNNLPLYPPEIELDTPEWDAWAEESERLINAKDQAAIEATWASMFVLTAWELNAHTQAVLHEIQGDWVAGAEHMTPRESRGKPNHSRGSRPRRSPAGYSASGQTNQSDATVNPAIRRAWRSCAGHLPA